MSRKQLILVLCTLSLFASILAGCNMFSLKKEVNVKPLTTYEPRDETHLIETLRQADKTGKNLSEVYKDVTLIDIHNHDAGMNAVDKWSFYGIDRLVLFGNISEPSAQITDQYAWDQYRKDPSHVYPSFAGFPIYEDEGLAIVQEKLEQGYLNIGEVAAASSYSPIVSNLKWKSQHPNDGNLPKIYDLAAQYRVPILLHIDPPTGEPILYLEKALEQHPDTLFIFAHANAYNSPKNIESLLKKHPNLYIDFFPGFNAYNPESSYKLQDFVQLIEQHSDRFMLSTDSGYGLSVESAALALYEIIDLLSPETAAKVAFQNYERLIELQPPTETQIAKIKDLSVSLGEYKTYQLNKRMANELIFELEDKLESSNQTNNHSQAN